MKRAVLVCAVAATLLSAGRVYAHHSFAATYLADKMASIDGELVQFAYRNPHAIIQVMAPDANHQMQKWTVEWEARADLDHQGVTGMTLKAGDHVIITGNPGRNASDHWLRATTILRPKDGWKWSAASMR